MKFEWNGTKARSNIEKHKVSFEEASTDLETPCQSLLMIRNIPHRKRGLLQQVVLQI
jgi:uncharacterized DUF497 family protein|tara:strand:- start:91 stop:261 length:171 start_codon:yes stop_codon:yes gene_type:complete